MSLVGVLLLGRTSRTKVLGLDAGLRSLLALQSAGCSHVFLVGPDAEEIAVLWHADHRVKIEVSTASRWPRGGAVIVGSDVVLDAKAAKRLCALEGEVHWITEQGVLCAKTILAADTFEELMASGSMPVWFQEEGVAAKVDSDLRLLMAEQALLEALRKPQDGWVSKALNRRMSLFFTRYLTRTGLRPNDVSLAVGLFGAAAAWGVSRGTWEWMAFGGVCFQLQSILDGCDGELARLTYQGSKAGEWIDTILDDLTNYGFFLAAGFGLRRAGLGEIPLWIAMAGVGTGALASAIEYRYLLSIGSGDLLKYPLGFGEDPEASANPSLWGRVLGALRPAFKRDFFVFAAMLSTFAGPQALLVMLVLFAIGALFTLVAVLASEIRRAGKTP